MKPAILSNFVGILKSQIWQDNKGVKMTIQDSLQAIVNDLTDTLTDAEKMDKGNKAAGARVRKAAQKAKADLQALRIAVQDLKKA